MRRCHRPFGGSTQLASAPPVAVRGPRWHRSRVPIRAILFDADGVLQGPGAKFETCLRAALGAAREPLDEFLHEASAVELLTLTDERNFCEVLAPVLQTWNGARSASEVAACWLEIEPDPAILALITRLRHVGYFCALATNQHRERGEHMASELGYDDLFDRSYYSYELGQKKPDAAYFQAVLATLPFSPGDVLFIDDHEVNVAAAGACGLAAAHFVHDRTPHAVSALTSLLQRWSVTSTPQLARAD
jgi:putative hydrolase of the HAD superfamily